MPSSELTAVLGGIGAAPGGQRRKVTHMSLVVRLNRNGVRRSRLNKMWQRVFFCNFLQSINITFKV